MRAFRKYSIAAILLIGCASLSSPVFSLESLPLNEDDLLFGEFSVYGPAETFGLEVHLLSKEDILSEENLLPQEDNFSPEGTFGLRSVDPDNEGEDGPPPSPLPVGEGMGAALLCAGSYLLLLFFRKRRNSYW